MDIINLGNNLFSNYLLCAGKTNILIDAGNGTSYKKLCSKLAKHGLKPEDINYIFLTHSHKDHISYLSEFLNNNPTRVICHSSARQRLLSGTNADGKGFNALSSLSVKINKALGFYKFKPFDIDGRCFYIENNPDFFEKAGLDITIIPLTGHTEDSIGLLVGKDTFFVGDAANNLMDFGKFLPFMYEDKEKCLKSLYRLSQYDCTIYPGHGKPFASALLKKSVIDNSEYKTVQ